MKTAILDTSVLVKFLRGDGVSVHLFDKEVRTQVELVTSPILLQELFQLADAAGDAQRLEDVVSQLKMLPVDVARSAELLAKIKTLRNRIAHSNDLLILGSSMDCDYLVTYDRDFLELKLDDGPEILTPERLLTVLGAHV